MPRNKTKKVILTLGLAVALAAGGVVTASNMGFKFVKNYTAVDPQLNTLSIPYFQSQFATTRDLFNDLGLNAKQVCRLNPLGGRTCWLGDGAGSPPPLAIVPGQGYQVGVSPATTQVIVGSHDPALNIGATFLLPDPALYLTGMPYHTTYVTTRDIFNDIPGAKQVCRLIPAGGRTCWLGDGAGSPPPVTVVIGDSYAIAVTPAGPTWIPDHY